MADDSGLERAMQYCPLSTTDEIRLVQIEPSQDLGSDVHLHLQHYNLASAPPYFALSYTWGPPFEGIGEQWDVANRYVIWIDGAKLSVTLNLRSALRNLRESLRPIMRRIGAISDDEPILLWIDAICINQEDFEERSAGVLQMRAIYSEAVRTLIWLMPSNRYSSFLNTKFTAVNELYLSMQAKFHSAKSDSTHTNTATEELDEESDAEMLHLRLDLQPENAQEQLEAVLSLFQCNWWRRAWVVQEFLVGQNPLLICGMLYLEPWIVDFYLRLTNHVFERRYDSMLERSNVSALYHRIQEDATPCMGLLGLRGSLLKKKTAGLPPTVGMMETLNALRTRECSDSRDKIYAGLGLMSEFDFVKPDYSLSIPQLYVHLARKLIERHQSLFVLGYCIQNDSSDIPSWAPDWRICKESRRRPLFGLQQGVVPEGPKGLGRAYGQVYNAGASATTSFSFSRDSKVLAVDAVTIDELDFVGRHLAADEPSIKQARAEQIEKDPGIDQPWIHAAHRIANEHYAADDKTTRCGWLYQWLRGRSELAPPVPSVEITPGWIPCFHCGNPQFDELIYKPTEEPLRNAYLRSICGDSILEHQTTFRRRMVEEADGAEVSQVSNVEWLQDRADHFAASFCLGRRFIVSRKQGFIGLGPDEALPGDVLALIPGCEVPLLLRPLDDQNFRFVGECYVHGIMDGEWFEEKSRCESAVVQIV